MSNSVFKLLVLFFFSSPKKTKQFRHLVFCLTNSDFSVSFHSQKDQTSETGLLPLGIHIVLCCIGNTFLKWQRVCMCMCEKRGLAVTVRSACGLTHRKADWGVRRTILWGTCCLGHVRCDNCNTAARRDTCHHDRSDGGRRAVAISLLCAFRFGLWATSNGAVLQPGAMPWLTF